MGKGTRRPLCQPAEVTVATKKGTRPPVLRNPAPSVESEKATRVLCARSVSGKNKAKLQQKTNLVLDPGEGETRKNWKDKIRVSLRDDEDHLGSCKAPDKVWPKSTTALYTAYELIFLQAPLVISPLKNTRKLTVYLKMTSGHLLLF